MLKSCGSGPGDGRGYYHGLSGPHLAQFSSQPLPFSLSWNLCHRNCLATWPCHDWGPVLPPLDPPLEGWSPFLSPPHHSWAGPLPLNRVLPCCPPALTLSTPAPRILFRFLPPQVGPQVKERAQRPCCLRHSQCSPPWKAALGLELDIPWKPDRYDLCPEGVLGLLFRGKGSNWINDY